jgi:ABC-type amino acid transport substrate-binding protein
MTNKPLLLIVLFAVLLFPACGGGGDTSRTMDGIRLDKELVIGTVPFGAPLLYQSNQELIGADAKLGQQMLEKVRSDIGEAATAEIKLRWSTRTYEGLVGALENEEIDLVLGVFGITPERKERVAFSAPYYTSEAVLVINPLHQDIRKDRLAGRNIGVRAGTAIEQMVREKISQSTVVPFKTLDDAVLALKRSEIDAVIDDRNIAAYALDTVPGVAHLEIVPGILATVNCGVAVRQEDEHLLGLVDGVLSQLKLENSYSQWLNETAGDVVARVESRQPNRLEKERLAVEPRRITIRVSKDRNYDFDIYRMANLSFRLTHQKSGKVHSSSRIDFKKRVGVSSVTVLPGIYKIVLPKMNNWSPGQVQILANDPGRITVNIVLLPGGTVRMTKS